jgi:hypothetical protein
VFGPKRTAPQGEAFIDRDQSPSLILGEKPEVRDVLEEAPERLAIIGLGKECGLPSPSVGYGKGQSGQGTIDHCETIRARGTASANYSEKKAGQRRKRWDSGEAWKNGIPSFRKPYIRRAKCKVLNLTVRFFDEIGKIGKDCAKSQGFPGI